MPLFLKILSSLQLLTNPYFIFLNIPLPFFENPIHLYLPPPSQNIYLYYSYYTPIRLSPLFPIIFYLSPFPRYILFLRTKVTGYFPIYRNPPCILPPIYLSRVSYLLFLSSNGGIFFLSLHPLPFLLNTSFSYFYSKFPVLAAAPDIFLTPTPLFPPIPYRCFPFTVFTLTLLLHTKNHYTFYLRTWSFSFSVSIYLLFNGSLFTTSILILTILLFFYSNINQ